jgi:hypothetical protein
MSFDESPLAIVAKQSLSLMIGSRKSGWLRSNATAPHRNPRK